MSKRAVLAVLKRLEFAHELVGDPRKARVFKGAQWPLRSLTEDFEGVLERGELTRIRGIGRGVERVARQVMGGEEPQELAQL